MLLAYLKPDDIEVAMGLIPQLCSDVHPFDITPSLQQFVQYFSSQWITQKSAWNLFTEKERITNNDLEAWHNVIKQNLLINNQALPFWRFIHRIGLDAIHETTVYEQLSRGETVTSRPSISADRETRLVNAKSIYKEYPVGVAGTDGIKAYLLGLFNILG
jgi:hypothetical protein